MAYSSDTEVDASTDSALSDAESEMDENIKGIIDPQEVCKRELDLGVYSGWLQDLWAYASGAENGMDIPHPHGYDSTDYAVYLAKYHEKLQSRVEKLQDKLTSSAKIYIPYRDEGRGKAAFYDHYTVQRATGMETVVVASLDQDIESFMDYVKASPLGLPLGRSMKIVNKKVLPEIIDFRQFWWWGAGLIFIPGCAVDAATKRPEAYRLRDALTTRLLSLAERKGLPILAVCGGSYKLYQYYGIQSDKLVFGHLKEVKGHAARKMPSVSEKTGLISDNAQVHDIELVPGTVLSGIVQVKRLMVNSVHSKAPDEGACPPSLEISARSVGSYHTYHPEERTVEAFEAKYGAPVVATVFHPEAYARLGRKRSSTAAPQEAAPKHCTIIKDMSEAGIVAHKRRRVMAELLSSVAPESAPDLGF